MGQLSSAHELSFGAPEEKKKRKPLRPEFLKQNNQLKEKQKLRDETTHHEHRTFLTKMELNKKTTHFRLDAKNLGITLSVCRARANHFWDLDMKLTPLNSTKKTEN